MTKHIGTCTQHEPVFSSSMSSQKYKKDSSMGPIVLSWYSVTYGVAKIRAGILKPLVGKS